MPELPEVETIRRSLLPLRGATLTDVEVTFGQLRRPVTKGQLTPAVGERIVDLERHGKYLLVHLSRGLVLLFHFGMTGTLLVRGPGWQPRTHDHVWLLLDSGAALVLNDPRRFGLVRLAEGPELDELQGLGPDAWSGTYDGAWLFGRSRLRKTSVKNWLMDQRVLAGLGNIYATEALHRAGIRPGRAAGRLRRREAEALHLAIRTTLAEAIEAGGSSISDFRDARGYPGYFQHRFRVYERAGEPCFACGTRIRRRVLGGRSTFYCPTCQP